MRKSIGVAAYLALVVSALLGLVQSSQAAEAPGGEVTLTGMVLNQDHIPGNEPSVFIYVLDGPAEVKAEFDAIMKEFYPEKGLDGDAARRLQDEFTKRLMYYIDGPLADKLRDDATYNARQPRAVTGVIHEKDGKKWITASACELTDFAYPAVMLKPDEPLVMPDKEPLVMELAEGLSMKCIYVPAGKFFMGEPYFMSPHWQEDPPHMVTLTKGYYMAECPVTWEMYDAVTGSAGPERAEPKAPANLSCADIYEFCRILSEKSGKTVRMPTAAEWDYAARSGTSNPPFAAKFAALASDATKPVKSGAPNAWGFYGIFSTGWERVSDSSSQVDRQDTVDPKHIPAQDSGNGDINEQHGHFGKGNTGYAIGEVEYITNEPAPADVYPGIVRFRIVVEEEEPAE